MTVGTQAGLPDNVADILPLSPVQAGMLYECLTLEDAGAAYAALARVELEGPLEPDHLREVLKDIALGPDSLRAGFVHNNVSEPVQVIRQKVELPFAFEDLTDCADPGTRLATIEDEMRRLAIALTDAPLMRTRLVRLTPERHVLLWTIHHLIADGWSLHLLLERLVARLNGATDVETGPSMKAHLRLLRARDRAGDREFWGRELAGLDKPTHLSSADAQPRLASARCAVRLGTADLRALSVLARRWRTSVATLLSVGWALCLRRITSHDDVVFGTIVSGRDPRAPGVDGAIGSYAGMIPFRLAIDPDSSLAELVSQAQEAVFRRADFEAATLADAIRSAPGSGLPFDTLLSIMDFARPRSTGPVRISRLAVEQQSQLPLAVVAEIGDGVLLGAHHDPARLSPGTATGVLEQYGAILKAIAARPDVSVRDIAGPEFPAVEQLEVGNHLQHAIHRQAALSPEKTAMRFRDVAVSYRELDGRAGALSRLLTDAGIGRGDLVPIVVSRSERAVIAMLGVLYAGAAYVPIDPEYPAARRRQVLDRVNARVVVSDDPHLAGDAVVITLPEEGVAGEPVETSDGDPAYVIFTSGSTGRPKGVVISHANLAWSNGARGSVYGTAPKAFLHLSSFAFDSSVVGIYWTLSAGGTLVIAPPRAEQDPVTLLADAERVRATHLLALPDLWRAFLAAGPVPASLDTVIVAGEAAAPDLIRMHFSRAPHIRLFNEYGPTEGTVWCAAAELHRDMEAVPIGQAPLGAAVDVCDAEGHPLPPGIEGELIVRGQGVAQGYLGDPEATVRVFVEGQERRYRTGDRGVKGPDGALFFRGRLDNQVKLRGHRVELEEIEAAARAAGAVEAGAGYADDRIILAVTGDCVAVRRDLPNYVPAALLPLPVVAVEDLPRLPNGKIDRAAIASLKLERAAETGTSDDFVERWLAAQWENVLGVPVGPETNFFEAGGDSLKSIGLLAMAEEDGIALKPGDVFTYPVLGDLAAVLKRRAAMPATDRSERFVAASQEHGSLRPFFMIHGSQQVNKALAAALGRNRPLIFRYSHHMGGTITLADRVETLTEDSVTTIRRVQPDGPYLIGGYSLGGLIALETARQLEAAGQQVQALFLIDPSYDFGPAIGRRESIRARIVRYVWILRYAYRVLRDRWRGSASDAKWHTQRFINRLYRPAVINAPTVLVRSANTPEEANMILTVLPQARTVDLPFEHLELIEDDDAIVTWTGRLAAEVHRLEAPTNAEP